MRIDLASVALASDDDRWQKKTKTPNLVWDNIRSMLYKVVCNNMVMHTIKENMAMHIIKEKRRWFYLIGWILVGMGQGCLLYFL